MERKPEFTISGDANKKKKEEIQQDLEQLLFNHFASLTPENQETLKQNEYPKSKTELSLIEIANQETNNLRQRFGLSQYNIPIANYHFITNELYRQVTGEDEERTGLARPFLQGILFDADRIRRKPISLGLLIFHETFHLKSFLGLKILEAQDEPTQYRSGTTIMARGAEDSDEDYHEHFIGLNEAIVSMLNREFLEKMIELPIFKKEKKWMQSRQYRQSKSIATQYFHIPEDEALIEKIDRRHDEINTFMYLPQRQVLAYVCEEIQKQFPDQYHDFNSVFDEFLKTVFTGGLITIGRLVEKTFGPGSFRLLGMMGDDKESAIATLEALKKAQNKQLRN